MADDQLAFYRQKFLGRGKHRGRYCFLIQCFIVPGIFQEQLSSFENQAVLRQFLYCQRIREGNILVIADAGT